ncbi:stress-induced-phosphoprotein 1 [Vigna unguiculata]|uniref:Stress-induced-phosphoprotein 1 n=1 Tax=Vigna unguiculata TaxID=3917 RepID=A0A4D6M8V7_VIGUN|nr:stress-induced-phosphoprotein 1 [Vigna unguiculata]
MIYLCNLYLTFGHNSQSLQGDSTRNVPIGKVDNKNKLGDVAQEVLVDFKENPKAAQEHTKNPMMMNKIQKVVNVGIFQMSCLGVLKVLGHM